MGKLIILRFSKFLGIFCNILISEEDAFSFMGGMGFDPFVFIFSLVLFCNGNGCKTLDLASYCTPRT